MKLTVVLAVVALAGCGEIVTPDALGDYTTWKRIDVTGPAPGHGDTYRIIYANDIAADPTHELYLGYPEGAIIVKEIYDNVDDQPGALRYSAVMRRIGPVEATLVDEGGWLYTDVRDGVETYFAFCWNRCHVAAPYNGAWYDYRDP